MKPETPAYYSKSGQIASPDRNQARFENPADDPSYSDAVPTEMKDPDPFGAGNHIEHVHKKRKFPPKPGQPQEEDHMGQSITVPPFQGTFAPNVPTHVQSQDPEGKKTGREHMFTP